jgi:hypothetical protein
MAERLNIKQSLEKVMRVLQHRLQKKLEAQGHYNTGRLSKSLEYEVVFENGAFVGRMGGEDYGLALEFGIRPEKIPYSPGRGRGGRSQYIQGLVKFWQGKGLNDREALSAAFATANVHKREGVPTRASYQFSRTGTRTGFITEVLNESIFEIQGLMEDEFEGVGLEIALSETKNIDLLINVTV